jgi:hypothetical protein
MGAAYDSDDALLLSGEAQDFRRFYDRYVESLLAFFQRRTLDPEAAADLTAETFAAALVARKRYEERATPARHGARAGRRRRRRDDPLAGGGHRGRDGRRPPAMSSRDYAELARSGRTSEAVVRKRVSRGLQVLRDKVGGSR